jgi:hypothetical protein
MFGTVCRGREAGVSLRVVCSARMDVSGVVSRFGGCGWWVAAVKCSSAAAGVVLANDCEH